LLFGIQVFCKISVVLHCVGQDKINYGNSYTYTVYCVSSAKSLLGTNDLTDPEKSIKGRKSKNIFLIQNVGRKYRETNNIILKPPRKDQNQNAADIQFLCKIYGHYSTGFKTGIFPPEIDIVVLK